MENIEKLASALCKAQSEIKAATKNAVNPFFHSKYADLEAVSDACKDALLKNGLCVAQPTQVENGVMILETVLMHTSGQTLCGKYIIKPSKDDPQGMGAALTYARRYALAAMVGVVVEDDDGNKASGTVPPKEVQEAIKVFNGTARVTKQPSASPEGDTVCFVPSDIRIKEGVNKNNKPYKKGGIVGPDAKTYGTFDEKIIELATKCQQAGLPLTIKYQMDPTGKYYNIVTAESNADKAGIA